MNETWLRELLEHAAAAEPLTGPATGARNSLRAGIELRRRRRALRTASGATVVAVITAAALAVTGVVGKPAATPVNGTPTVYVLGDGGMVTPVSTATNKPGEPIVVRSGFEVGGLGTQMATTPSGKTVWVAAGENVTSVSTVTNTAGKPVQVVRGYDEGIDQVLVTPDGKTAYVLDTTDAVTPISTATRRPGQPIELGRDGDGAQMAITPDGKTLYVAMLSTSGSSYVIPIATATNRPGKPIRVATAATAIVVAPDGNTVYVIGQALTALGKPPSAGQPDIKVTPIATATNRAGKPIVVGKGYLGLDSQVAMTPDGQTLYILDGNPYGVIAFSTAANRPGKLISLGNVVPQSIAITPDGSTAYVISTPLGNAPGKPVIVTGPGGLPECTGTTGIVTPIATATNTVGKPIKVGCGPTSIAITPDGKTVYVGSQSGTVTPIATATGQPGKPIDIEYPVAIVITP